jgi:hypothetical protein
MFQGPVSNLHVLAQRFVDQHLTIPTPCVVHLLAKPTQHIVEAGVELP